MLLSIRAQRSLEGGLHIDLLGMAVSVHLLLIHPAAAMSALTYHHSLGVVEVHLD